MDFLIAKIALSCMVLGFVSCVIGVGNLDSQKAQRFAKALFSFSWLSLCLCGLYFIWGVSWLN